MIDLVSFLIYRIKVTFHFLDNVEDMNIIGAWRYSRSFGDFWEDEYEPLDAVLEEISNWTY